MKLRNFMLAALPALLFVGCSDQVDGPDEPNGGDKPTTTIADGYMAIKVNLPTTPSSRANDNFDDGDFEEYNVQDGAVLLFVGANEKDAVFNSAYELPLDGKVEDSDKDNITTSYQKAIKINNVDLGTDNLYALVMLNYKKVGTIGDKASFSVNTTGGEKTLTTTTKFSDFNGYISKSEFYSRDNDGYFFMTNAPLSSAEGGALAKTAPAAANISTLVQIKAELIFNTEGEATSKPAASVFVERAVAKATLKNTVTKNELGGTIKSVEWALGNVEPTSYVVRNMGDMAYIPYTSAKVTDYRFVGGAKIGETSIQPVVDLYRTYWCIDPTYSTAKSEDDINAVGTFSGATSPLYCYENTFDVAHQSYNNTTRAVIKITYEGGDFYTIGSDMTEKFTEDDAISYPKTYIFESQVVKDALKDALKPGQKLESDNADAYLDITFKVNENKVYAVTGIAFKPVDSESGVFSKQPAFAEGDADKLIKSVNSYYVLNQHTGGVSYYEVRIRHFDNTQAPWTAGESTETTAEAYEGNNNDYLGRYGMVRNNWYELEVTKINNWGSATVPDIDVDKPDDNEQREQWIAFKINVLSWAKRTQNVEL